MKYLERFFRYVFWIVVSASIAWLVKKLFEGAAEKAGRPRPEGAEPLRLNRLFRDPMCGTYVAEDISYSLA